MWYLTINVNNTPSINLDNLPYPIIINYVVYITVSNDIQILMWIIQVSI